MSKLSFEEWLQLKAEYAEYVKGSAEPAEEQAPAAEPENEPAPAAEPEQQPEPEAKPDPMDGVRAEIEEIKKAMGTMAKALQPSLGDIKPVGIDDVVSKFFEE